MSNSTQGFNNGNSGNNDDYTYYSFGNMISDLSKNITEIKYNHLNLPYKITFDNGANIQYMYDASGIKLRKRVFQNNKISITEYFNGFHFNNDVL